MNASRRKRNLAGERAWVVGASSGIGAALATELHAREARLAISARRADRLAAVAGGRMLACPLDVTDAAAVEAAAGRVCRELGGLDTVVFSAGTWERFDARHWDRDGFARHVEVNLLGLNNVLAAVLPAMIAQGCGRVVVLGSLAGYRGLAGAEAYGATKAAQLYLVEALRAGLAGTGVRTVGVSPGFVRTEMTADNAFPMPFLIEPEQAARSIADGLARGARDIAFPLPMALGMRAARLLPGRLWDALSVRAARR